MSRNSRVRVARMSSIQCTIQINEISIDCRDKSKHAALRRTMRPVSNMSTLDEISPTIEVFLQRLITGIEKEAKERQGLVDVKNWLYNFTFAVCALSSI